MTHSPEDIHVPLAGDTEDPSAGPTWLVAIASAILLLSVVLASIALFYAAERREVQHKVVSIRSQESELMREERRFALEQTPHWEQWTDADGVLAGERTLVVPMDVARDLVKKRWSGAGN
jgi:hypothetical protein